MSTAEGLIRNDTDRETVVAFDKDGKGFYVKQAMGTSVTVGPDIRKNLERFRGGVLTHNHPHSASFSFEDLEIAGMAQLSEIRAVSRFYRYTFHDPEGNMELAYIETLEWIWREEFLNLHDEWEDWKQTVTAEEYLVEFTHEVAMRFARRTRLVYNRTEIVRKPTRDNKGDDDENP